MAYRYKVIRDCTVDGVYHREGEVVVSEKAIERASLVRIEDPAVSSPKRK